jgi:hypothetical protein
MVLKIHTTLRACTRGPSKSDPPNICGRVEELLALHVSLVAEATVRCHLLLGSDGLEVGLLLYLLLVLGKQLSQCVLYAKSGLLRHGFLLLLI